MFKTETLIAFTLVAKHRSFTIAANVQKQTPMAMSKQVSQLENRLAEPLFERSTRKIRLTEFGEQFLAKAQKILAQHDSLSYWLESRQGKFSGTLRVIAHDVQVYEETVFPWIAEFQQLYPDIELMIDIKRNMIDLDTDAHDIYWGLSDYLGIKHPGLKRRSLWEAKYGIFAAPDYLEKFGTPKTPTDLKNHQMIGHPHQEPNNVLVVNKSANSSQKEMESVLMKAPIKTVDGHAKLAVQGLGLFNVLADNHDVKAYLASKQLVPVLEEYWYSSVEIYIYYHQVKLEQPKIRAFIDFFLSKRKYW